MSWKQICDASDVPTNSVKKFSAEGVPLVIANYDGKFRALPPLCPHMEEPLAESGVIADCVLTCTKHLWSWNLSSLEMLGETEKPLRTYETKQEDGKIFALIEQEIVYDFEEEDEVDDDEFFAK